jgi:transposase
LKSASDPRVVRRVVALLDLDGGASVAGVAARLGMTRQTLYNWVQRYGEGGARALPDRARRGRPPKLSGAMGRYLVWLLKQPPDAFGYAAVGWTVPLLRRHLAVRMEIDVSDETLRRALHGLNLAWKRPRYVLRPDPDREKKTPNSP